MQMVSRRQRATGLLAAVAAALAALLVLAAGAGAAEEGETGSITFPGTPLTVSIAAQGQCQSSYASHGNNFFPPNGNVGDCGLFLAFPKAGSEQPEGLQGTTWGYSSFAGSAGPALINHFYTPAGPQPAVTGSGTAVSPFAQTTTFYVEGEEESKMERFAEVAETTTYVNGEPQFVSTFTVKNTTKPEKKIYFRAIYAADLYLLGDDYGTGVFLGGPPRFVGGQNPNTGALGGLEEVSGAAPWTAFQEGCWNSVELESSGRCAGAASTDAGIWNLVASTAENPAAFNDTVDPALIDNGVGAEWDQLREAGLGPNQTATFSIINRTQVPSNLQITPVSQTLNQGQTETLNVSATDLAGVPYAGRTLHYTVTGANPQSGAVTLNGAGQAQVSYVGNNPGIDTIQMFVDLTGSGVQTPGDPSGSAGVTWIPSPNSSYKVSSIKANANGTITITFVPVQSGTAAVVVTVPTGTIARHLAEAAKKKKKKKCKKGQSRIKGKCRPTNTVSGKATAPGTAGVPLTIVVKPSSKVTKALKKGKTVLLTVKLSYTSSLGGTPTVQTFHEKVKPKKKKKHKK